jgi:ribosomal protein RSM22 (predicted rRNA methylase)
LILPGELNEALARWMAEHGRGSLGASSRGLSEAYRKGQTSSHVSVAAYLTTRVPATFAANQAAQRALGAALPDFTPESILDIGAGPGVASWAAIEAWPTVSILTQCEQDKNFASLAATLNAESGLSVLAAAEIVLKSETTLPSDTNADLVVASYMLAELPQELMAQVAHRLWSRTSQVLLLLEPGTPQGFARLRAVRDTLLGQGAFVLAPCTHQNACPMAAKDWCHFKARVQRSREHMHAKGGTVPFEDEAFLYLILSRQSIAQTGARIIAPPVHSKPSTSLHLCDASGLHDEVIASRDKDTYKRAKKKTWGDVWE